jgi:thiol-disulfide isomerase/thioredoxin
MVQLNMKVVLLGLVIVGIMSLLLFYSKRIGAVIMGFQSGSAPPSENMFTMYYAEWCPHCQTAKPAFQDLISKGYPNCKVRMIEPEKQPEEAAGKPVRGFPTFLLETTDGQMVEYKGERNMDGWLAFLNEKLGGK